MYIMHIHIDSKETERDKRGDEKTRREPKGGKRG